MLYVPLGRLLGTPNEEVWPGVSQLRDWHDYPQWKSQNIARAVPGLHLSGVDLLEVIKSLPFCSPVSRYLLGVLVINGRNLELLQVVCMELIT